MAGFGLMFGRIGDAAGSLTGILLKDKLIALVIIASICFVLTYAIFFMLYNKLYMPLPQPAPSQEERLHAFIQKHQLSSREIEVLNLITEGSSNSEISAKLFISENTVKFHVRNIFKKDQLFQSYRASGNAESILNITIKWSSHMTAPICLLFYSSILWAAILPYPTALAI